MDIYTEFEPEVLIKDDGHAFKAQKCRKLLGSKTITLYNSGLITENGKKVAIVTEGNAAIVTAEPSDPTTTTTYDTITFQSGNKSYKILVTPKTSQRWVEELNKLGKEKESKSLSANNSPQEPLYKDSFVTLYPDRIVIAWYWFPTTQSKIIPIAEIKKVTVPSKIQFLNHKAWGMAIDFDIWWASDMSNLMDYSDRRVIIDCGTWPKVGFSCDDRETFSMHLRNLLCGS